jgi:SPX domain protein involved in polyphosphate accumulation
MLQSNLDNASPIPNTDYTIIESVYYDNANLDVLTEYLAGQSSRSKMRTRRYAPNGVWGSSVFIEVKAKENGICNKSRFQIGLNEIVDLTLGKSLSKTQALSELNPSIKSRTMGKRIDLVNNFIDKLKTQPSSKITYSRLAYERGDFRVTVDQDLKYKNLLNTAEGITEKLRSDSAYLETMRSAQQNYAANQFILEVKHAGTIPTWMQEFLSQNQVAEASFSKYCYAMSFAVAGNLISTTEKKDSFAV